MTAIHTADAPAILPGSEGLTWRDWAEGAIVFAVGVVVLVLASRVGVR
jgi:hypothetical protein